MIINEEQRFLISEIDVSKFRINFDTLLKCDIFTFGFITEKKLATPVNGTRMSIELILRYQENGYIIRYSDDYLEDMYHLITLYNNKLKIDHANSINLQIPELKKSLEYVKKRMMKYPKKFGSITKIIDTQTTPFVEKFAYREQILNLSTKSKINTLERQYMQDEEELTWEDKELAYKALDSYYKGFELANKDRDKITGKLKTTKKEKLKTTEKEFNLE